VGMWEARSGVQRLYQLISLLLNLSSNLLQLGYWAVLYFCKTGILCLYSYEIGFLCLYSGEIGFLCLYFGRA
jgi:hypothetical protein